MRAFAGLKPHTLPAPLPVPMCTVHGPDLRRGASDGHDKQIDCPGYLSSHTDYTLPPFGGVSTSVQMDGCSPYVYATLPFSIGHYRHLVQVAHKYCTARYIALSRHLELGDQVLTVVCKRIETSGTTNLAVSGSAGAHP